MNKCVVYGLVDASIGEIRYIGQTKLSPARRLNTHISHALRSAKSPVHFWIRKVVASGGKIAITVIEPNAIWDETEIETISLYRAGEYRLLNLANGGRGCPGHKPSENERKARSARTKAWWDRKGDKGRPPWPAERLERHREVCRARGGNDYWLGKTQREESKAKTRAALTGRVFSAETLAKMKDGQQRRREKQRLAREVGTYQKEIRPWVSERNRSRKGIPTRPHTEEERSLIRAGWQRRKARLADAIHP
jgi:hypothetical protein